MVGPTVRTGLVIAGLVALFLWGLYKMALPERVDRDAPSGTPVGD